VNMVSSKLLGYTETEFTNMSLPDILFKEDLAASPIRLDLLAAGKSVIRERRFKRKDGTAAEVEVHSKKLPDGKYLGVVRDITERKKAEEKLKQLSQAVEQSPASVVITDLNGNIQYVNQKFINVTGYAPEEVIGKNPRILKSGFTSDIEYKGLWKRITSGLEWQGEFHNKKKNGEFYWESALISPIYNEKGAIINFLAIKEDITERKNAETRMLVAFERYDILARATSDTIWDWDMVNNKMLYNDGINKMFGYQASEVENVIDWWNERVHPDDFQKITESLDDIFENGLEKFQLTYRFRSADGSYKNIFDRAFVIFDKNHKPCRMIGAMQDITHQVQEEMRISKAIIDAQEEERRYIGEELHDNVNQILAGSLLSLGMAKVPGIDPEKASGFIEMTRGYIANAIDEIRKLSHQLVPATSKENSLKDIFENLLCNINLDKRFAIGLHFDEFNETDIPDNVQINLYRILQEQVKNILKYSEAGAIEVAVTISGNVVNMRIFDNGKGFDTKTQKNGIGLRNIKKRAESLSGKFILNSAPGKGCEIIVELPIEELLAN
jgi:two-component system sensor histidine kinase UhpB